MDINEARKFLEGCSIEGGYTPEGFFAVCAGIPNKYVYTIIPPFTDANNLPLTKEVISRNNQLAVAALQAIYPEAVSNVRISVVGSPKHPESQTIHVVCKSRPMFLSVHADLQKMRSDRSTKINSSAVTL